MKHCVFSTMASLHKLVPAFCVIMATLLSVASCTKSPVHVGRISSYLRVVFRPETARAELNHFLVSDASGTEYVYIGAVDTIFQLDANFALVNSESTSDDCFTDDNDNKVLVVAPPPFSRLVLCRECDGYCEFRFLHDASRDRLFSSVIGQSAVNFLPNVGIFSEGADKKMYLFVAASYADNGLRTLPPISQRSLQNVETPFVAERRTADAKSRVTFLQGLTWKDFIFFLVHEHDGVDGSSVRSSKLGRLCPKTSDPDLDSYSEIPLTCGPYGKIMATHVGSDDVLYAVFTDGAKSALCSYTMADVQEKFVDATCGCASDLRHAPECHLLGKTIDYIRHGECNNKVCS